MTTGTEPTIYSNDSTCCISSTHDLDDCCDQESRAAWFRLPPSDAHYPPTPDDEEEAYWQAKELAEMRGDYNGSVM